MRCLGMEGLTDMSQSFVLAGTLCPQMKTEIAGYREIPGWSIWDTDLKPCVEWHVLGFRCQSPEG
jgi:hypothetical protein